MPFLSQICCAWFLFVAAAMAQTNLAPQTITYPVGKTTRPGFLFKPKGNGPFSAMIWVHASAFPLLQAEPPSTYAGIAKAYLSADCILFIPDRHLQYVTNDEFSPELQQMLQKNP